MCGIAGIISPERGVNPRLLKKMTSIIEHRGPDDEGFLLAVKDGPLVSYYGDQTPYECRMNYNHIDEFDQNANVGFGFRRLSILDLTVQGHQPMISSDGMYAIVFNGEIYNYIEIRLDLISKGYQFKSSTDTEVLLNAYIEYGTDCVKQFNGMWAFAIYDRVKQRVFCSRDRLGVKPFHYVWKNRQFAFSSEAKQLLEDDQLERTCNLEKIYEYAVLNEKSYSSKTFFSEISSLEPGHNLIFNIDSKESIPYNIMPYWRLGIKEQSPHSRAAAIEQVDELLLSAVKLRLRSDVPVAACLSGGIDSNCVMQYIAKLIDPRGFDVFTTCFIDKEHRANESDFSRLTSSQYGLNAHYVYPEVTSGLNELSKILWHQEEPISSASMVAEWAIMKAVNENGIKVLMGGQGGDECFIGYSTQVSSYLLYLLQTGKLFPAAHYGGMTLGAGAIRSANLAKNIMYYSVPQIYHKKVKAVGAEYIAKEFLEICDENVTDTWDRIKSCKNENELMNIYISNTTLPANLYSEDRNSMAFSIESRAPFVDYRIVELAASTPIEWHLHKGWTKSILRELMQGNIPDQIVHRKAKIGFEAPQEAMMQGNMAFIREIFSGDYKLKPIVNNKKIQAALENSQTLPNANLWKLMCMELWVRQFNLQM